MGEISPTLRRHRARVSVVAALISITVVVQGIALAAALADGVAERAWTVAVAAVMVAGLAMLARAVLTWFAEVTGRRAGSEAMADLRGRILTSALATVPGSRGGRTGGEIATLTVHGGDAVERWAGRVVLQQALAVTTPVAALVAIAWLDWLSAAILLPTLPLLILFLVLAGADAKKASDSRLAAMRLLGGHMLDVLRGLPVLRSFGRAERQAGELERAGDAYRRETVATLRSAFTSAFVLEFMAMLGTALVAVTAGVRLVHGSMDFEPAMAVLLLAPELYLPLRNMGNEYHAAAEARATLDAARAACEVPEAIPAGHAGVPSPDPGAAPVTLDGVRVVVDGGRTVLDGAGLTLAPGRTIALIGASGAGKSTVLRLLLGLQAPTSGFIRCGDVDIADTDLASWRDRIAWIPQSPVVLPDTLAANLRIARADASDDDLWEALRVARLDTWARGLPNGLDERVGDGGVAISAGERRRLGLARAVLRRAGVILADEPTANLDARTAELVRGGLRDLVRDRSAVIVTHEPDVLDLVDDVLELRDGRIAPASGHVLEAV